MKWDFRGIIATHAIPNATATGATRAGHGLQSPPRQLLRAGDSDVSNQVLAACALSRVITTTTYGDAR